MYLLLTVFMTMFTQIVLSGISRPMITKVIDSDEQHQLQKPQFKNKPPLTPVQAKEPMERMQADVVNLSSVSTQSEQQQYHSVLVMLDVFSRFLWLYPLSDKTCMTVSSILKKVWQQFGPPRILQTDNGSEFIGPELASLCHTMNVKIIHGRPRHPQSQGKVHKLDIL